MTHPIRPIDAGRPASIASAGRGQGRLANEMDPGSDELDPSGPLIGDDAADIDIFPDGQDLGQQWYVPTVSVVMPAPDDDPATAPFRYTFVTHPDQSISATVVVTIATSPPPGAKATSLPIPLNGLTAALSIPYRSEADGTTMHVTPAIQGAIQPATGGRFTISFPLPGDFVARAAYGNLSVPGFQDETARIQLAFTINGYGQMFFGSRGDVAVARAVEIEPLDLPALPVELHPSGPEPDPTQPADTGGDIIVTVITQPPATETTITVNLSGDLTQPAGTDVTDVVAQPSGGLALNPAFAMPQNFAAGAPVAFARPNGIEEADPLIPTLGVDPANSPLLVPRQVSRTATADLSFPCSQLGGLYRRINADGTSEQVGCRKRWHSAMARQPRTSPCLTSMRSSTGASRSTGHCSNLACSW